MQDQYDNIAVHTQKGIEFLERYGNFIRDRCTIELEYAGKLRFLHQKKKNYYQVPPVGLDAITDDNVGIFFFFFCRRLVKSYTPKKKDEDDYQ